VPQKLATAAASTAASSTASTAAATSAAPSSVAAAATTSAAPASASVVTLSHARLRLHQLSGLEHPPRRLRQCGEQSVRIERLQLLDVKRSFSGRAVELEVALGEHVPDVPVTTRGLSLGLCDRRAMSHARRAMCHAVADRAQQVQPRTCRLGSIADSGHRCDEMILPLDHAQARQREVRVLATE